MHSRSNIGVKKVFAVTWLSVICGDTTSSDSTGNGVYGSVYSRVVRFPNNYRIIDSDWEVPVSLVRSPAAAHGQRNNGNMASNTAVNKFPRFCCRACWPCGGNEQWARSWAMVAPLVAETSDMSNFYCQLPIVKAPVWGTCCPSAETLGAEQQVRQQLLVNPPTSRLIGVIWFQNGIQRRENRFFLGVTVDRVRLSCCWCVAKLFLVPRSRNVARIPEVFNRVRQVLDHWTGTSRHILVNIMRDVVSFERFSGKDRINNSNWKWLSMKNIQFLTNVRVSIQSKPLYRQWRLWRMDFTPTCLVKQKVVHQQAPT